MLLMPAWRPVTVEFLRSRATERPSGCLEWTGSLRGGYGQVSRDGRPAKAHRVMAELTFGPLPDGAAVMHTCDNPPCINPAHLVVGTQPENVADMWAKGRDGRAVHPDDRWARGSRVGTSRLTEEQVALIKRDLARGVPRRAVAREYGVSTGTVGFIKNGTSWRHVEAAG